jgi:hypothetical protein
MVLARTHYEQFVVPQLINVRGISEKTWERKRPIWEGDCERERNPRKKAKTKLDSEVDPTETSVDGQGEDMGDREHDDGHREGTAERENRGIE